MSGGGFGRPGLSGGRSASQVCGKVCAVMTHLVGKKGKQVHDLTCSPLRNGRRGWPQQPPKELRKSRGEMR